MLFTYLRDVDIDYIKERKTHEDVFWNDNEKWYYYSYKNQDYIIPGALLVVVAFFCYPPGINLFWCGVAVLFMLFLCHLNNSKLDKDPNILKHRLICKEIRYEAAKKGIRMP